jgi:DNA-binding beta-propeller fold protein YncE
MLKKRSGWHRKPRRSVKPTSNIEITFTINLNAVTIKFFVVVAIAGLLSTLASVSVATLGGNAPKGLAFDATGNLFVANDATGRIFKFTPDGTRTTFAAGLIHPFGIAFDANGNLFVADMQPDQKNGVILRFTPEGKRSTFASDLTQPLFLAFDSAGNLFVLDMKGKYMGTVLRFAPDGSRSVFAKSGLREDDFINAAGPVLDRAGNLFISDSGGGNTAILKFAPDGSHTTFFPGLGNPHPSVLALDNAGNLYVSLVTQLTPEYTEILKITPEGKKETFATGTDTIGMAFDKAGNLFAADDATGSILKFTPEGAKSEFAHEVASISPDERWEYQPATNELRPRIVKAGTNEVAGELACDMSTCGNPTLLWSPDSKRFAFYWGQGRTHQTALYQLNGDKWIALKSPGNDDEIEKRVRAEEVAQLKRQGVSKKAGRLRLLWDYAQPNRWTDASTLIVRASLAEMDRETEDGFGADFLFTLKFDHAGKWKIIKTHRMSEKEVEAE